MHCLAIYDKGKLPERDGKLYKHLLTEAKISYGHQRTQQLLSTDCKINELASDILLRAGQLQNLVLRAQPYASNSNVQRLTETAKNMVEKLLKIIENITEKQCTDIKSVQYLYRDVISTSTSPGDSIMKYINICEGLRSALVVAEQKTLLVKTYTLEEQWLHKQGLYSDFQPKFGDLFQAIQEDLIKQFEYPADSFRVRIGLIGYTSAGKSTVTNRLLGVTDPKQKDAAAVSMAKSTFFPSEFNRVQPFIDTSCEPPRRTFVTIVDIQGLDHNRSANNARIEAGNYLDEIVKADCDIYLFIFDKMISDQQKEWIKYIEDVLRRRCILVRSKVDQDFLEKFTETHDQCYSQVVETKKRDQLAEPIIEQLRQDNAMESRKVFLVAFNYRMTSLDAQLLSEEQFFDNKELIEKLGHITAQTLPDRVYRMAARTLIHITNTCFRRGYILNLLTYVIATCAVSVIPFGTKLTRYWARLSTRDTVGINKDFHKLLKDLELTIDRYDLQTSVFKNTVNVATQERAQSDDSELISNATNAGSQATTSSSFEVWTTPKSGIEHILKYMNRLCNDIITVSDACIKEVIRRQRMATMQQTPE